MHDCRIILVSWDVFFLKKFSGEWSWKKGQENLAWPVLIKAFPGFNIFNYRNAEDRRPINQAHGQKLDQLAKNPNPLVSTWSMAGHHKCLKQLVWNKENFPKYRCFRPLLLEPWWTSSSCRKYTKLRIII